MVIFSIFCLFCYNNNRMLSFILGAGIGAVTTLIAEKYPKCVTYFGVTSCVGALCINSRICKRNDDFEIKNVQTIFGALIGSTIVVGYRCYQNYTTIESDNQIKESQEVEEINYEPLSLQNTLKQNSFFEQNIKSFDLEKLVKPTCGLTIFIITIYCANKHMTTFLEILRKKWMDEATNAAYNRYR
jgi:hypothetical protein